MNMDKKEMVRYSRNKKNNRNGVLFTFREGNLVFFGISRCCEKDSFNRERGIEIAQGRAAKALAKSAVAPVEPTDEVKHMAYGVSDLTRSSLFGFVEVSEVPVLLNWFRSLNK